MYNLHGCYKRCEQHKLKKKKQKDKESALQCKYFANLAASCLGLQILAANSELTFEEADILNTLQHTATNELTFEKIAVHACDLRCPC